MDLEYVESCKNGGLHCIASSGCQVCYRPVLGGVNIGSRPVCGRFNTNTDL